LHFSTRLMKLREQYARHKQEFRFAIEEVIKPRDVKRSIIGSEGLGRFQFGQLNAARYHQISSDITRL
jgi:hypothetical protein